MNEKTRRDLRYIKIAGKDFLSRFGVDMAMGVIATLLSLYFVVKGIRLESAYYMTCAIYAWLVAQNNASRIRRRTREMREQREKRKQKVLELEAARDLSRKLNQLSAVEATGIHML